MRLEGKRIINLIGLFLALCLGILHLLYYVELEFLFSGISGFLIIMIIALLLFFLSDCLTKDINRHYTVFLLLLLIYDDFIFTSIVCLVYFKPKFSVTWLYRA